MRKVALGFIGSGPRGQGVIRQFNNLVNTVSIKAVCDKFESQARKGLNNITPDQAYLCTDHRQILEDNNIEAVYVCVEPENNADLVVEALQAGKHVMCDVPLAYSIEDCRRIVLEVEKSDKTFLLGEQIRYEAHIEAWKKMREEGRLGDILLVQGQYCHGRGDDRYFCDQETGERLDYRKGLNNPNAEQSRTWKMPHSILYLPHELSPLLRVLDDRVVKVTCMATPTPSRVHDWFPYSDLEMALMQTEKGTVMRMMTNFTTKTHLPHHWHNIVGTKGAVETPRFGNGKGRMWFADSMMTDAAEVNWGYVAGDRPPEAARSGHSGADYTPLAAFADAILNDTELPMSVYQAAETAAPAILAAQSIEQNNACLEVPDFRPGAKRQFGKPQGLGHTFKK